MDQNKDRYNRGMETLLKIADEKGFGVMSEFRDFYPAFEEMMVSFGYGDVWSRKELDLKQRGLITLSSLITQGAFEQLGFHVNAALRVGLKPKEIVEVVIHCAAYAGFPKACTAFGIVMRLFDEQNIIIDKEG